MILPRENRSELVHNAAGHAGEVVLGALTEQGLLNRVELLACDRFNQCRGGDFKGGATGESAANRHARINHGVETGDPDLALLETGDYAAHVVRPGRLTFADWSFQIDVVRLAGGVVVQRGLPGGIRFGGDDGVAVNRHRQDEAVVVV